MKRGRYENKVSVKPRSGKKTALIIVSVIAVLILGVVGVGGYYINSLLDGINHVEISKPVYAEPVSSAPAQETEAAEAAQATGAAGEAGAAEPEVVYSREDFDNFLVVCKPVWTDGSNKTQTMILVTLNKRTKAVTLTSLMEGAYVDVPAYKNYAGGQATLDSVYGLGSIHGNGTAGSMELMNQTLYENFGIEVEENFEIDMKIFSRVVTRLDYVTFDLSETEAAYLSAKTGKDIQPGQQNVNGSLAEAYVEMWSDENAEGINPLNCQKKMAQAIIDKIRNQYVADLEQIVKDLMPTITTSMSYTEFREFLMSLLPLVRTMTIENGGTCPMEFEAEMLDIDGDGTEEEVLRFDAQQTAKTMRKLTLGEN